MSIANTFTSLKPDMKETYGDKKKSFKKIRSRISGENKKCGCTLKKEKCSCKSK